MYGSPKKLTLVGPVVGACVGDVDGANVDNGITDSMNPIACVLHKALSGSITLK